MVYNDVFKILDNCGEYNLSDHLFKYALDVSLLSEKGNELGRGSYGKFFSDFPQDYLNKTVGEKNNFGLKVFHGLDISNSLKEFIFAQYITPIINTQTKVHVPIIPVQNFSNFISIKAMFSRRVNGMTICKLEDDLTSVADSNINLHHCIIGWNIVTPIFYFVKDELHKIGIDGRDIHNCGNIMVKDSYARELIKDINIIIQSNIKKYNSITRPEVDNDLRSFIKKHEIMNHLYLIDFGKMYIDKTSVCGLVLKQLINKLESFRKNSYINQLIDTINEMMF